MSVKDFLKSVLCLVSITFIVSCASGPGTDSKQEETKVNLDAEEQKELKERQAQVGGSHSQLRKLFQDKRYRELLEEAAKILSKDQHDLAALSVLGLYHMQMNQFGAARIFFEKALLKHSDEAGLYNNIGVIQIREGNLQAGLASFKKAYDMERNNAVVQANLGSIYVKYMDYVEAEPLVEDAYSTLTDNSIVANNYAIVLRTQGQYEEAEKVYTKALERDSRNISTNLNYAILLIEYMKKYQKAQQIVNKIEFLNPTDRYVLAKVKELQHKVTTAK